MSGPLLDRIDVHVEVPAVPYEALRATGEGETSAEIRERVTAARRLQLERYAGTAARCNADLSGSLLERWCAPDAEGHALLESAVQRLGLSARAYTRVLRLARTIADLEAVRAGSNETLPLKLPHLAEAVALRVLDRQ